jgi:hypothetical protein
VKYSRKGGRNGDSGESDLRSGIGPLFIMEAMVGARNGPLNRVWIFGPEDGSALTVKNVTSFYYDEGDYGCNLEDLTTEDWVKKDKKRSRNSE